MKRFIILSLTLAAAIANAAFWGGGGGGGSGVDQIARDLANAALKNTAYAGISGTASNADWAARATAADGLTGTGSNVVAGLLGGRVPSNTVYATLSGSASNAVAGGTLDVRIAGIGSASSNYTVAVVGGLLATGTAAFATRTGYTTNYVELTETGAVWVTIQTITNAPAGQSNVIVTAASSINWPQAGIMFIGLTYGGSFYKTWTNGEYQLYYIGGPMATSWTIGSLSYTLTPSAFTLPQTLLATSGDAVTLGWYNVVTGRVLLATMTNVTAAGAGIATDATARATLYTNAFGIATTNAAWAAILNSLAAESGSCAAVTNWYPIIPPADPWMTSVVTRVSTWEIHTNEFFAHGWNPPYLSNTLFVGCSFLSTDPNSYWDTEDTIQLGNSQMNDVRCVFIGSSVRNLVGGDLLANFLGTTTESYDCFFEQGGSGNIFPPMWGNGLSGFHCWGTNVMVRCTIVQTNMAVTVSFTNGTTFCIGINVLDSCTGVMAPNLYSFTNTVSTYTRNCTGFAGTPTGTFDVPLTTDARAGLSTAPFEIRTAAQFAALPTSYTDATARATGSTNAAAISILQTGTVSQAQGAGLTNGVTLASLGAAATGDLAVVQGRTSVWDTVTSKLDQSGGTATNLTVCNLTFTNSTIFKAGILNGTNGVYWALPNGTNYWLLLR